MTELFKTVIARSGSTSPDSAQTRYAVPCVYLYLTLFQCQYSYFAKLAVYANNKNILYCKNSGWPVKNYLWVGGGSWSGHRLEAPALRHREKEKAVAFYVLIYFQLKSYCIIA